ncbi:MAG TPA: bifunctional nuclease domain-containing protein [Candidatus Acidoferrales bacterium]|nr:bifunctional nuclease domain-containing protein [Candidatus Acidoferrales bacterium]
MERIEELQEKVREAEELLRRRKDALSQRPTMRIEELEEKVREAEELLRRRKDALSQRLSQGRMQLAASPMEREVKVRALMMDPLTNMPVVVLKAVQGAGTLPIWVGIYEANAIALEIEKVQTPRPMTHDLLKNVLLGLDVHVQKVVVSELKDDTFYALIWMERAGQMMSMDSRPSDALALALRLDCPIYVEEKVFKSSQNSDAGTEKTTNEELKRWLQNLNDEDLGPYKM